MQRSLGEQRLTTPSTTTTNGTNGTNGNHATPTTNGALPDPIELDALVVGAGFAGIYLLHRLRQSNFSAKIVEAGTGLGGIWHWNSYPGARVDSQYPIYQFSLEEIYKGWSWSQHYPDHVELRRYFDHVDSVLGVTKDCIFGTKVVGARFEESEDRWIVTCDTGLVVKCRFFLCCTGFAAKRHFPDWEGLEGFKGTVCHSSFWPREGMDVKGKRVAVVGTGATGIQIAQTTARTAAQLTVFQRTPNLCCPMRQAQIDPAQVATDIANLPATFAARDKTYAGFLYETQKDIKTFDHSTDEQEAFLQKLWDMGGFRLLANNYGDMLSDAKANRVVYDFWAKKIRERITDPVKRDILAPLEPPHPFGGKRLSLEQDFYEQMNKETVEIVDLKATGISKVVPEGIVTSDGKVREFDVIAIATGFDSFTGGLKDINPIGLGGQELREKWKDGTWTAYGLTVSGFPNFFFLYGPQAPTAYANGPSITEPQGEWCVDVMRRMREAGKTRIDGTDEAEKEWKKEIYRLHSFTLRNDVDSWYMGANIPGKPREPLNYAGGIPQYLKTIRAAVDNDFEGFTLS